MMDREADLRDLEMLRLRDECGLSAAEIGHRLGRSRASVLGIFHRVREGERQHEAACEQRGVPVCQCVKPENQDAGMAARWWAGAA
ncbi:hypothetical protein PVT71_14635 [Salipiger sp. H15]|uniref:Uncharacterized protein n=1 Tax=Alloyangia sp. H15 TaxID=3029062 RepID=A0AAU8AN16_9RHOB